MISTLLRDDHRKISEDLDNLLKSIRSNKSPHKEILNLRKSVQQHIYIDETHMFKIAENDENRTRIRGLEIEHAGILQLINKIEEYLQKNDLVRALDRAEGLARVMEAHNDAEDSCIYAGLEKINYDPKKVELEISNDTVPPEWKCNFLQR